MAHKFMYEASLASSASRPSFLLRSSCFGFWPKRRSEAFRPHAAIKAKTEPAVDQRSFQPLARTGLSIEDLPGQRPGTDSKNPMFWNITLDKTRLKSLISWFLEKNGEKKTLELLEHLKTLGFGYATQAGISLGIEDLSIPSNKIQMLAEAENIVSNSIVMYRKGEITGIEKLQQFIETWHETSENLKQEVVKNFEKTDILNPVYMMAFSGARGNLSQVRQLVGMRGLMADPQGKIIDFPIQSNFREGLTLTEYLISTYGARKGIVDTALRTATAGYLTRRLVDVAQHVLVSKFDCGTRRGIFLFDMKEGNRIIYAFSNRLTGRVLAQDIYLSNDSSETIAFRNQEIDTNLAFHLSKVTKKALVRSPLTCETRKLVCQLCYGWSLATTKLVSIGEAVGVIAGQSIGEPGTQLTMRTFHTGGVFAGGISEQINAPFSGWVEYPDPIAGSCIRTSQGFLAFLTKAPGNIFLKRHVSFSFSAFRPQVGRRNKGRNEGLRSKDFNQEILEGANQNMRENAEKVSNTMKVYKIPAFTILFARNGEFLEKGKVLAQVSSLPTGQQITQTIEQTVYSSLEGEVYYSQLDLLEDIDEKYGERVSKSEDWGKVWVLACKISNDTLNSMYVARRGDLISKKSIVNQVRWMSDFQQAFFLQRNRVKPRLKTRSMNDYGYDFQNQSFSIKRSVPGSGLWPERPEVFKPQAFGLSVSACPSLSLERPLVNGRKENLSGQRPEQVDNLSMKATLNDFQTLQQSASQNSMLLKPSLPASSLRIFSRSLTGNLFRSEIRSFFGQRPKKRPDRPQADNLSGLGFGQRPVPASISAKGQKRVGLRPKGLVNQNHFTQFQSFDSKKTVLLSGFKIYGTRCVYLYKPEFRFRFIKLAPQTFISLPIFKPGKLQEWLTRKPLKSRPPKKKGLIFFDLGKNPKTLIRKLNLNRRFNVFSNTKANFLDPLILSSLIPLSIVANQSNSQKTLKTIFTQNPSLPNFSFRFSSTYPYMTVALKRFLKNVVFRGFLGRSEQIDSQKNFMKTTPFYFDAWLLKRFKENMFQNTIRKDFKERNLEDLNSRRHPSFKVFSGKLADRRSTDQISKKAKNDRANLFDLNTPVLSFVANKVHYRKLGYFVSPSNKTNHFDRFFSILPLTHNPDMVSSKRTLFSEQSNRKLTKEVNGQEPTFPSFFDKNTDFWAPNSQEGFYWFPKFSQTQTSGTFLVSTPLVLRESIFRRSVKIRSRNLKTASFRLKISKHLNLAQSYRNLKASLKDPESPRRLLATNTKNVQHVWERFPKSELTSSKSLTKKKFSNDNKNQLRLLFKSLKFSQVSACSGQRPERPSFRPLFRQPISFSEAFRPQADVPASGWKRSEGRNRKVEKEKETEWPEQGQKNSKIMQSIFSSLNKNQQKSKRFFKRTMCSMNLQNQPTVFSEKLHRFYHHLKISNHPIKPITIKASVLNSLREKTKTDSFSTEGQNRTTFFGFVKKEQKGLNNLKLIFNFSKKSYIPFYDVSLLPCEHRSFRVVSRRDNYQSIDSKAFLWNYSSKTYNLFSSSSSNLVTSQELSTTFKFLKTNTQGLKKALVFKEEGLIQIYPLNASNDICGFPKQSDNHAKNLKSKIQIQSLLNQNLFFPQKCSIHLNDSRTFDEIAAQPRKTHLSLLRPAFGRNEGQKNSTEEDKKTLHFFRKMDFLKYISTKTNSSQSNTNNQELLSNDFRSKVFPFSAGSGQRPERPFPASPSQRLGRPSVDGWNVGRQNKGQNRLEQFEVFRRRLVLARGQKDLFQPEAFRPHAEKIDNQLILKKSNKKNSIFVLRKNFPHFLTFFPFLMRDQNEVTVQHIKSGSTKISELLKLNSNSVDLKTEKWQFHTLKIEIKPGWLYKTSGFPSFLGDKLWIDAGHNLLDDVSFSQQPVLLEKISSTNLISHNFETSDVDCKETLTSFNVSRKFLNSSCRFSIETNSKKYKQALQNFTEEKTFFYLIRPTVKKIVPDLQKLKTQLLNSMEGTGHNLKNLAYFSYKKYQSNELNQQTNKVKTLTNFIPNDVDLSYVNSIFCKTIKQTKVETNKNNRRKKVKIKENVLIKKSGSFESQFFTHRRHVSTILSNTNSQMSTKRHYLKNRSMRPLGLKLCLSNTPLNWMPLRVSLNRPRLELSLPSFSYLSLNTDRTSYLLLSGENFKNNTYDCLKQQYLNLLLLRSSNKNITLNASNLKSLVQTQKDSQGWNIVKAKNDLVSKLDLDKCEQGFLLQSRFEQQFQSVLNVLSFPELFSPMPYFEFGSNRKHAFFANQKLFASFFSKKQMQNPLKLQIFNPTSLFDETLYGKRFVKRPFDLSAVNRRSFFFRPSDRRSEAFRPHAEIEAKTAQEKGLRSKNPKLTFHDNFLGSTGNLPASQNHIVLKKVFGNKTSVGLTSFYSPFEGEVLKIYKEESNTQSLKKSINFYYEKDLLNERQHQKSVLTKSDIFSLNFDFALEPGLLFESRTISAADVPVSGWKRSEGWEDQRSEAFRPQHQKPLMENSLEWIKTYHQRFQNIENDYFARSNPEKYTVSNFHADYQNKRYKIRTMDFMSITSQKKFRLGEILNSGERFYSSRTFVKSGLIIHLNRDRVTLRKAEFFSISPQAILHTYNGQCLTKNTAVMTLPFQTLKTGDIVQGIPKVEQYLEARTTVQGRLFLNSLPVLLNAIHRRYSKQLKLEKAVRQSFLKIQQILVDGVQRVYRSQGVSIADKHLEIIVRQMTSKVKIVYGAQTGFFPGELIDLEFIERINSFLMVKVRYEPVVLGITRASLEVDSFLSAASFQQTTKVLTKSALENKRDFLKGLKENLLVGNLLPAGTGYVIPIANQAVTAFGRKSSI